MNTGRNYYVYILSSGIGGKLYIGVTNDLVRRVHEHKTKSADGFTKKHGVDRLVYYEQFEDVEAAIRREKTPQALSSRLENPADRRTES